jgi:hypothetical protein
MGCLHHLWTKCQSTNGFAIGALSKPRFFKLDRRTSFNVFFHGNLHLVKTQNLKDYN